MTRLRTITIGSALLLGLILAVLAYLLANAQSEDRKDARERFDAVATISASVTNGTFQAALTGARQRAAAQLGAEEISPATLEQLAGQGQLAYVAVLDSRGRALGATAAAPEEFGSAIDTARQSGKPRFSDYMELDGQGVIEWAVPYDSAAGRRIYVQGSPASTFERFLNQSLRDLPGSTERQTAMVDGNGVVLGGVALRSPVGETIPDDELLEALQKDTHGTYGDDRYFAAAAIDDSPFRVVLDTTQDNLYEDVETTLPWIIFAAFALTALAGLLLLRRALATASELERKEISERHAVEINDNIIQGLALAKYQLQVGQDEASAAQVAQTLREAQRLVSGLLGDAEVQAGQLRREVAAETGGPDDEPAAQGPR